MEFDYVITLCDNGKESGPYFPARTRVMHKGINDPLVQPMLNVV